MRPNCKEMRPNCKDILEATKSANIPHNMQEGKLVSTKEHMMGPCRSARPRKTHSRWENYTK
ncbi:hypothetical protein A2U01_0100931, partial [Trifolium medium]|nr:hypothetical protein [Trifolium medium]